jgi:hypothetical protein
MLWKWGGDAKTRAQGERARGEGEGWDWIAEEARDGGKRKEEKKMRLGRFRRELMRTMRTGEDNTVRLTHRLYQ